MPINYRQLLQIVKAVEAGRVSRASAQGAIGSAVDISAARALDFPGPTTFRRSAVDVAAARGPLPGGVGVVSSRGVGEDLPGLGYPTQPNVRRAIPIGSAVPPDSTASTYSFAFDPPPIDVEVLEPGGRLTIFDPRNFGPMRRTGVVVEDLTQYPQSRRIPTPDVMAPGAGRMPGTIPFSEEAIRNALTNGVRTGNLKELLGLTGIAAGTAITTALLGSLLRGRRKDDQPKAVLVQAPVPGTAPQINPPGTVPQPGQTTGGVEQAATSPVPKSPAGQVVLETPGDSDERLREMIQQYTGQKSPTMRPGGKEVKNELAVAYAAQADFGRQNIDKIVNELGLTGNMEIWARSNPLPAARLYLQMESKKQQQMDLKQRTEFPSPAEMQPRGISEQNPSTVQGQMVNTTLGADYMRNMQGSIVANTESQVMPTQGSRDLAQALTPLAQPTLVRREDYTMQTPARQAQLRELIFQQYGAR